jgi:glycosyltransferase involved in cell wall biosynthesis
LGIGSEVVLLQVSRLERWKGHTLLLDALARMRVSQPWVLWIAGGVQRPAEARYLDELRERVAQLHLTERVRFLGERADVPQLLAAADIFCQTNLEPEPLGLSIVEALSAGLPVVTTRAGGPAEFLNPSCAVLVDDQDPGLLATQLARLLQDEEGRRAMGSHARDLYEREFEPGVCSDKFSEVLGKLASSPTETAWG